MCVLMRLLLGFACIGVVGVMLCWRVLIVLDVLLWVFVELHDTPWNGMLRLSTFHFILLASSLLQRIIFMVHIIYYTPPTRHQPKTFSLSLSICKGISDIQIYL